MHFTIPFYVIVTKKNFRYLVSLIKKNSSHIPVNKSLHDQKHLSLHSAKQNDLIRNRPINTREFFKTLFYRKTTFQKNIVINYLVLRKVTCLPRNVVSYHPKERLDKPKLKKILQNNRPGTVCQGDENQGKT